MGELHLLDNALDKGVKVTALLVVCGADVIYTVIEKKVGNLVLLSLLIHSNGGTALLLNKGHTGDVGDPGITRSFILSLTFLLSVSSYAALEIRKMYCVF